MRELLGEVDSMRDLVRSHIWDPADDVDVVLQSVREIVWRISARYDPTRGSPHEFVFGITRNVLRQWLHARPSRPDALPDNLDALATADSLAVLERRFEAGRWTSMVAKHVGEKEWAAVVDLMLSTDGTKAVAARHELRPAALARLRHRVYLTTYTVRGALSAADAGLPITPAVLLECVPDDGRLREVATFPGQDADAIASAFHIHPGRARAEIATLKRLLGIAQGVLRAERAAWAYRIESRGRSTQ
ncbi:hypothetical protein GCM10022286_24890 [Gryllotalpicola daejeonensis]|uniref:Sigma-70 family RNA polymerase sigma factor n=1 Tax=Gryllotalpicola daejeonensis TaxID=993087 RepID=A0ABP7ZM27_9MICO